jgi:hypothetical protein
MPFREFTYKFNYCSDNYSSAQPVSVVANYAKSGKFVPIYFIYTAHDESLLTIKIDCIKYVRDYPDRILFCCLFTNCDWQQEVYLEYHILNHLWTILPQ